MQKQIYRANIHEQMTLTNQVDFYYSLKTLRKTYESLNEPTPWINIWLTASLW